MTEAIISQSAAAAALRTEADQHDQDAFDSFERCDTDGFVSQWASGLTAQQKRMEANLIENGGLAEFPQLTDLDGTPVPAKLVQTRYGTKFAVFATADDVKAYNANVIAWIDPYVKEKTLARKGYVLVYVLAPAKVVMHGSNACTVRPIKVRTDGGFDANAVIVPEFEDDES